MKLSLIFLYCLTIIFNSIPSNFGGSNGDECMQTEECEGFLECINNRCHCRVGTTFIGDNCYILAGEACPEPIGDQQRCAPRSSCEESQGSLECVCDTLSGFTPNIDLRCFLPYEESCRFFPNECDPAAFLTCSASDFKCRCQNPTNTYYSPSRKTCVLLAGSNCDSTEHATKCTDNANCLSGQCQCTDDYEANTERKCTLPTLGYGDVCFQGARDYCDRDTYLECGEEDHCSCSNVESTYYNAITKMCHIRANFPCTASGQPCIANSLCDEDSMETACKCRADLGFTSNPLGQCVQTWNIPCNPADDQCDREQFLECDSDSYTCSCKNKNDTWFEETTGSCKLLAEAECSTAPNAQECIEKASCTRVQGDVKNICNCKGSRVPNKMRQCFLPFDTTCDPEYNDCNPDAFLLCNSQHKCACKELDTFYFPENQECVVKPGGKCEFISEGNPACVANAYCNLSKTCNCRMHYEDTPKHQCRLMFNSPCEGDVDECNADKNLSCKNSKCACADGFLPTTTKGTENFECHVGFSGDCSPELPCSNEAYLKCDSGKCTCLSPLEQHYDDNNRKCYSLIGRRCNLSAMPGDIDTLLCGENAFCNTTTTSDGEYGICACEEGHIYNGTEPGTHCIFTAGNRANFRQFSMVVLVISIFHMHDLILF